jgi:phage terminase small subunit
MTCHNELMSNTIDLILILWQNREEREEAACTEHRRRVQEVYKMAADLGVSAKATPELFAGVMHIVENDNRMELFFTSNPDGRLFVMKQYSRVDN